MPGENNKKTTPALAEDFRYKNLKNETKYSNTLRHWNQRKKNWLFSIPGRK